MNKIVILLVIFLANKSAICQVNGVLFNPPSAYDISVRKSFINLRNYDKIIGKNFGEFCAKDITGKMISNNELIGKITFINFWFYSCAPCHLEFDKLNHLYTHYATDTNFQVITFTFDNVVEAKKNSDTHNLLYKIISIPNQLCDKLILGKGYPCNFIIDETGKIVFGHGGFAEPGTNTDPFKEIIIPKIDSLLLTLKTSHPKSLK